jgi:hypothetical protein
MGGAGSGHGRPICSPETRGKPRPNLCARDEANDCPSLSRVGPGTYNRQLAVITKDWIRPLEEEKVPVLQHCATCQTEYIATATACAECGEVLQPGPLPRYEGYADQAPASDDAAPLAPTEAPTRALGVLPGEQAERLARALTNEGIVCLLECEGFQRLRLPGDPVPEPIAVTLPVQISIPPSRFDDAQGLLALLEQEDVIGRQWEDATARTPDDDEAPDTSEDPTPATGSKSTAAAIPLIGAQPESTTWRFILVLLLVAGLAWLFLHR